jgi:hypothetical protein
LDVTPPTNCGCSGFFSDQIERPPVPSPSRKSYLRFSKCMNVAPA